MSMKTQRVDVYISGAGLPVFQIEQYNPELRQWFIVGDVYEKLEYAQAEVEVCNMRELTHKLLELKGATK